MVIEAALLIAVGVAAFNHDSVTVATTFSLSNGVFVRVFPLAPAPLVFLGVGLSLVHSDILPRAFGQSALVLAALFEVAGIAAIFGTVGVVLAVVMSITEAIWIAAAAIALGRHPSRP